MKIDQKTVRKIAELSCIDIEDHQISALAEDLNGLLNWVEQLNEVEVEDLVPMTSALTLEAPLREDIVTDGGYPEAILKNSPKAEEQYFIVPKVIE